MNTYTLYLPPHTNKILYFKYWMQRRTWIPYHEEHLKQAQRTAVHLSLQYRRGLMRGPNLPVLAGNETFTRFSILEKLASILSYECDKRVGFSHYWPVSQMSFSNIKLFCFHHPCLSLEMWPEHDCPKTLYLAAYFLLSLQRAKQKSEFVISFSPQTALFSGRNVAERFLPMRTRILGCFTREQRLSHLI